MSGALDVGTGRGAEDWGSLGSWKGTQVEWTARSLSPCLLPALQLLLWHIALWMVPEAAPLSPASSLPQSFLLKCLEQVRKIQADGAELQERLVSEGGRQRRVREGTEVLQEGAQRRGWGRRRRRDPWERMPPDWERRDWGVMDWQGEVEPWALAQSWGRGRTSWGQCWEGLAAEWTEEGEQEAWWEVEGGKDLREMGALGREDSPALSAPLTRHPSRPQCATHKLCHPQELVLLGHSLGLPQASLSSCSSQALQLVSSGGEKGGEGVGKVIWKEHPLTPPHPPRLAA